MSLNISALKELLHKKHRGNYAAMARETGVEASILQKLINGQASVGLKNCNRLADYLAANAE